MTKLFFTATAASLLVSLAACSHKAQVVDSTSPDPMANALANAQPVVLPPSISASESMRCKDNSLVYVDFFSNNKQANLRTSKDGAPITLTAANAGDPLTGQGYTLTGNTDQITLTQPGKGTQTCDK